MDRFTQNNDDKKVIVDPEEPIDPAAIGFRNAVFSWDGTQEQAEETNQRRYRLQIEGELFFKRNSLNLIIGPTGSGKTSVLMALLGTGHGYLLGDIADPVQGEMHFEPNGANAGFRLPRGGGVAYAAQEAWVQNETIKASRTHRAPRSLTIHLQDNILFGKAYSKERYEKGLLKCYHLV